VLVLLALGALLLFALLSVGGRLLGVSDDEHGGNARSSTASSATARPPSEGA
jgi:hypothetical protein